MSGAGKAKSTTIVVPPDNAARVPDSKSSVENVPMNGISRCVCGVDAARHDVAARRIQFLVAVQALADLHDLAVLDKNVGMIS